VVANLQAGEEIKLEISGFCSQGRGVGRVAGCV